jgi:hypothetical protein
VVVRAAQPGSTDLRQGFSISVTNLVKLVVDAKKLPAFRGLNRALTSNDIRDFLKQKGMHAKDVFEDYYTEKSAIAVLTYEWTMNLFDICSFLNGPTIREYNRQHKTNIPDEPEQLTLWIDVFQLDQNCSDMQGQLLQSEVEFEQADLHIILGTSTVGTRAWCLYEAATRHRIGKKSHVLKSLQSETDQRFNLTEFVATTKGHFYEEMCTTSPADLNLIRRRIDETYGSQEKFNGALLLIFQAAAFMA